MKIKRIYDTPLAHASYAIATDGKVFLVDPGRDTQPYIDFADRHNSRIVAVFETHPHADFVSSHLELHQRFNADIYVNPKVGAFYPFHPLEHHNEVKIGKLTMKALFTPGHSPDHNSYLLIDENGAGQAVFSGDSLFVGDVGRPDLREGAGNIQVSKKELASMMFNTIHSVFDKLDNQVKVYPAHGPGSLCGKSMSQELESTIGKEKKENWVFQMKEENQFIATYLEGQSFIPKYFPFNVELNRNGVETLEKSLKKIPAIESINQLQKDVLIIDVREQEKFKKGHIKEAINIQNNSENAKFETWLGAIVGPEEKFYLVADNNKDLDNAARRAAKIGYESNIKGTLLSQAIVREEKIDLQKFKENPDRYTIVDIRNESEVKEDKIFKDAINIPLPELRERADEIKTGKPVVVHCAGGYRSAVGSSILAKKMEDTQIYDLSDAVEQFK